MIDEHNKSGAENTPKELAKSLTELVHGEENYNAAVEASSILFKKGDAAVEALRALSSSLFMEIFDGVPQKEISKSDLVMKVSIIDLLSSMSGFLKSNGEARRAINENSISVNKKKASIDFGGEEDLIANQYILLQRGRKLLCT